MSLGADLKRERELRGITLEEMARETKIRASLLGYIEDDRFDRLPAGVFRRSFVRSYARYLGIDEDKPVREYLLVGDRLKPPRHWYVAAQTPRPSLGARLKTRAESAKSAAVFPSVVALLGALTIFYFVEVGARTDQDSLSLPKNAGVAQLSQDQASAPTQPSPSNGQLVDVSGSGGQAGLSVLGELAPKPSSETPSGASGASVAEPMLRIKAREEAWIRVSVGESTLFSGILRSDETRSFSLQRPLNVKLGNPLGTQLWVNDQVFGQLGEAGKTKTIFVSAENYQSFLAGRDPVGPSSSPSRVSGLN
ncbi:MAG: DUF4115 domain-containing protein [Acidobacteria bacterium]|nr:DUF4115 domain-containing protein [Acidobacteriota bacterium]